MTMQSSPSSRDIVDQFHRLYYNEYIRTWANTFWLGVPTQKCPLDLRIYQEILYDVRPHVIVETGTWYGGSALFLATICDMLEVGRVLSIDIALREDRPAHPLDLTGWTLANLANNVYTFPSFTLAAGATVKVWTSSGANSATDRYGGRAQAVWTNGGDTAFLRDGQGALVTQYSY